MATPLLTIVQGWTDPLDLTLKYLPVGASAYVPIDLTGLTVAIVLRNSDGLVVKDTTAGITVTGSTSGLLEYAPSSSSGDLFLAAGTPYRVRFRLTDALGKVLYHPNDDEELIDVGLV